MGDYTSANRRSLHLIVADDERDAVLTLAAILDGEGHSVAPAYNAPAVLVELQRQFPDAIVVDIEMPGISGLTVAREVRRIYGDSAPLLIAISGRWIGETDRMLSEVAGFDHFLQKPCEAAALLALLEPLVTRHGAPPPDFSTTIN